LGLHTNKALKRKAPQIIVLAIAMIIFTYVVLELFADSFVRGQPFSFTATISSWGYFGIFVLMLLEASSLPIPSEVILPFGGYLVSKSILDFYLTLTVATCAAVTGSLIDYFIGLKGFEVLTKYRVLGRIIFSENQLKNAAHYFTRYGSMMVFFGRLIPVIRTLISFPAGAVKMPVAKFIAYTLAGCLIWNSLLIYIGYYLGQNWREVADVSHYIIIFIVAAAIVLFIIYLMRKKGKNKKAGMF
jgi:membrane protein DedA with SNARE-associated domain